MLKKIKNAWPFLIIGFIAILAGGCTLFFLNHNSTAESSVKEANANAQVITVNVTADGFSPSHIKIKKGVPTQINFKKSNSISCIRDVVMEDWNMYLHLKRGSNLYTLQDLEPGTYEFHCGMYMYYGEITIV
ncbi:hypothetical protein DCC85_02920 [Paenibacillus sp. CAA11]|uniref:cupredoxin domain-containing protein n=1 Tax=Paenibacillus sp. CAA11 TaxID=1532905 RepID=UPI000D380DA3|nr:cupredoxin domain-containing protein [Paenibacillus sp. CAA11]AWB43283.1 hypothetical protein DCC85_02920 [Paenibacillus sp. CAA11]